MTRIRIPDPGCLAEPAAGNAVGPAWRSAPLTK